MIIKIKVCENCEGYLIRYLRVCGSISQWLTMKSKYIIIITSNLKFKTLLHFFQVVTFKDLPKARGNLFDCNMCGYSLRSPYRAIRALRRVKPTGPQTNIKTDSKILRADLVAAVSYGNESVSILILLCTHFYVIPQRVKFYCYFQGPLN